MYYASFRCDECNKEFGVESDNPDLQEADCPVCAEAKKEKKTRRRYNVGDGSILESRLKKKRFENKQCDECDTIFKKKVLFWGQVSPEEYEKNDLCPKCGSGKVVDYPRYYAPHTPESSKAGIKAIDITAETVMKDYGMSDINMSSKQQVGENSIPKLPTHLQKQADNFFGTKNVPVKNAGQMIKKAYAGDFGGVNPSMMSGYQPKINVVSQ